MRRFVAQAGIVSALVLTLVAPVAADDKAVVDREDVKGDQLAQDIKNGAAQSSPSSRDAPYHDAQIGEVTEVAGKATVTRADGTTEVVMIGTEIYANDIVETDTDGAVNIGFIDESSFAVSENGSVSIDEFIFDPESAAGQQDYSFLRGVFMYTSGLIGRENEDDADRDAPVGSLGIRG